MCSGLPYSTYLYSAINPRCSGKLWSMKCAGCKGQCTLTVCSVQCPSVVCSVKKQYWVIYHLCPRCSLARSLWCQFLPKCRVSGSFLYCYVAAGADKEPFNARHLVPGAGLPEQPQKFIGVNNGKVCSNLGLFIYWVVVGIEGRGRTWCSWMTW